MTDRIRLRVDPTSLDNQRQWKQLKDYLESHQWQKVENEAATWTAPVEGDISLDEAVKMVQKELGKTVQQIGVSQLRAKLDTESDSQAKE